MLEQNTTDFIYLIYCALNGIVPEGISRFDLNGIYSIADRHLLSAMISYALQNAGVEDGRIKSSITASQRKTVIMEHEKTVLFQRLEDEGIWYMPVKGAVLKELYPQFWMREMADYDILFDSSRADDVKIIMENHGFQTKSFNNAGNHDVYYKKPVTNFEMHRSLFREFSFHETDRLSSYYSDIKDRLIRDEGRCFAYHFSDEDFYVYMIAHEYKHFVRGGTGIRSLLDTYLYLKHFKFLDWPYIKGEIRKLGIEDFEKKNRELALNVFQNGTLRFNDPALQYILSSGVYGNMENFVQNNLARSKSVLDYIWRRLFIPLRFVKESFPLFYRYKVLLPFLPLYRLYLVKKKGSSTVTNELKILGRIR